MQAAVRAFRMGQKKAVFVYRLLGEGTMEQFIYDRQVLINFKEIQILETPPVCYDKNEASICSFDRNYAIIAGCKDTNGNASC